MYMGESALIGVEPGAVSVVASTAVDLLVLQRSDVVRILGPAFAQAAAQSSAPASTQVRRLRRLAVPAASPAPSAAVWCRI